MTQESTKVAKPATEEKKQRPQSDFFIIEIFKKMLEYNHMKSGIKKKF
jgi:hypothetical protein